MATYVYDIECIPNCFTAVFLEVGQTNKISEYVKADIANNKQLKADILKTIKHEVFVIFDQVNDLHRFKRFLSNKHTVIGYNNLSYDDIMIDFIYSNYNTLKSYNVEHITSTLKLLNDSVIGSQMQWFEYRNLNNIPYNKNLTSIDLMRLNYLHKLRISLKQVSINLKWYNLEDYVMPAYTNEQWIDLYAYAITYDEANDLKSFDRKLHIDEFNNFISYNYNDVFITDALLVYSADELKSRVLLTNKYQLNLLSDARSGVANKVMKYLYAKYTGLDYADFINQRTWRKIINFNNIINHKIHFKTPEFQEFFNRIYNISINVYGGDKLKESITFRGTTYNLGLGGIHSQDTGSIYISTDDVYIEDCDVNSYYPYSIILNKIKPAHISITIIEILNNLLQLRMEYKNKGDIDNANIYKIIINAVYGKYGDADSFLKDDLAMYTVTVNNQLFLLMLVEDFETNGIKVISANTDGLTSLVPKDKYDLYLKLIADWSKYTGFSMEINRYLKYVRANVNNYLVLVDKGDGNFKVKCKGEFDPFKYKDLAKGFNAPVVAYAIYQYYVYNIPIQETINNHTDILDFCMSQKTGGKFVNEYHQIIKGKLVITKLSKNIRYYSATTGGVILKKNKEDNNTINVLKGQVVQILNKVKDCDIKDYHVNYKYYINRCNDMMIRINNTKTAFMKKNSGTLFDDLDDY